MDHSKSSQPPSYHSNRWYKRHPEAKRPTGPAPPNPPGTKAPVPIWLLRSLGFGFILVGIGVMQYYFTLGVFLVYVGSATLIWEVFVDPYFLQRIWVRNILLAMVLILVSIFTAEVVVVPAPIDFYSYAMRKGNYSSGAVIEGITWDTHFTDLRITITNPSDDSYHDFDLAVQPDKWNYKAVIVNTPSGCDLTPIGGRSVFVARNKASGIDTVTATRVGSGFEMHDSLGNTFTALAAETGYRLRCGIFPAHFTIQVIFALVAVHPSFMVNQDGAPGTWGLGLAELAGVQSNFDLLDARPFPLTVLVEGSYTRKLKTYSIKKTVPVRDGN